MNQLEELRKLRRQGKEIRPKVVLALLLVLIILVTGLLVIRSSLFAVGSVVVQGNRYISVEAINQIAMIPENANIFRLNTRDIKKRLLADLRIASADVSRRFPGEIIITVNERLPLAYVASTYGFVEFDKLGMVLATHKSLKQTNLPMITGVRLEHEYIGDVVSHPGIVKVLQYLALLDESTLNQLSEINIQSPERVVAYTVNAAQIRLGESGKLAEKAGVTQDVLHEIAKSKLVVQYVDLTYAVPFIKFKQ